MWSSIIIIFGLVFSLLSIHCDKDATGPEEPLLAPILWDNPDDLSPIEKGIDAVPEENAIQLDWNVSNVEDIESILIYKRTGEVGEFQTIKRLAKSDTTWTDQQGIDLFVRYFYYAITEDRDGRKSAPSDTVSYMLIDKAFNLSVTQDPTPTFRWQIKSYHANEYVVKLFEADTQREIWIAKLESDYTDLDEEVRYNFDAGAAISSLATEVRYVWRVDIVGPANNSGSESEWQYFSLPSVYETELVVN